MKYFTMSQFATALTATAATMPKRMNSRLLEVAEFVKKEAESYIGNEQDDWDRLKDTTIALKQKLGLSGGPLHRTGVMKSSFSIRLRPYESIVESYNRALFYHETGTMYMPKRPVLSRAVLRNKNKIMAILGSAVFPLFTKSHVGY